MPDLVIDTQHHWFGPRYRAALAAEAAANPGFERPNALFLQLGDDHPSARLDDRVGTMDDSGVDIAVLSVAPPAAVFRDAGSAAEAITIANDEIGRACDQAPDRFVALGLLPLPHIEESVTELDRLTAQPAIRGILVGVDALAHAPDKLDLDPVLDRMVEAGYVLVIHPAGHESGPNDALDDFGLAPSFETMIWTSLVGLRFVLSGLLDRYPTLDVVIPHLGGVLPYVTQRLLEQTTGNAQHDLTHYLSQRLYYDNCSYHRPALRCAVDTVGAGRIMLGSDFPFRGKLRRCVDDVLEPEFLSDDERRAILGGTAARWFAPSR